MPSKKPLKKKSPQRTKQIAVKPASSADPKDPKPNSFDLSAGSSNQSQTTQPSAPSADQSPLLKVTKQQSTQEPAGEGFKLGVQIPHAAHEVLKNIKKNEQTGVVPSHFENLQPQRRGSAIGIKIWNTLEWIATSALIFMVLFFIINYGAYSTLFVDKLNQLRGEIQTNPIVENLTHSAGATQQPLPITATSDQNKKQIPYLNLEVAPPDDRVIIPRINRNVPIVKVSTENLIKRDWGALETDIQKALQYGVVHYPGTAEPGENGNVVITGHSSYFSWDPGRFKDVFALLHEVAVGDTVIVYHDQKKYFYQVYETKVVTPDKIDVLTQAGENRLTLITCTPVGTNLKRLVVFARPTGN